MDGKVVNIKSGEPFDVYIGREYSGRGRGPSFKRSIWHNPYRIPRDGNRREVIEKYERHLVEERSDLLERLPELEGRILGCWCKPEACHGDVLLRLIQERAGKK
jgi:hypothetical protein